jgi:SAM-dependent methyltransferase
MAGLAEEALMQSRLAVTNNGSAAAHYDGIAAYFDEFADVDARWRRRNASYHRLVTRIYRTLVPPGHRVLEVGSGSGDLLAELSPSEGVGVDVSGRMVELAAHRHPDLQFRQGAGETASFDGSFDYVVLSDVVPYVHDLVAMLENVALYSHRRTRVIINTYNPTWRPILGLAERLRLKPRKPIRNWVSPDDLRNVLELSGFEVVSSTARILMPKRVPLLAFVANAIIANIWPFTRLCSTYWLVARPRPREFEDLSVSVICPCRNEEGHIAQIVERVPDLGSASELIFVEGGSTDGTRGEIERQIALHPERDISLLAQEGQGKGAAVRTGFAAAKYEVLMILDGDVSVLPEDLPKFYRALVTNRGELINGSRLVYDMEQGSMRFLNMLGNKAFSYAFRAITGHHVKDTLCGTKVLRRVDYDAIARGRSYFGDFDPFGDFDLLFGAARLNFKIVDLPVRYQPRVYGSTNISRFRHGLLLLRMTLFAVWKFRIAPVMLRREDRARAANEPLRADTR